jgi:hypothetical protein
MGRPRLVLTAADHRYARSLVQLLLSAERRGAVDAHEWIAWDLGLEEREREQIARRFSWCRIDVFDFERHPPHVRRLVNCAWKPIVIARALTDDRLVLWLDSATIIRTSLDPLFARAEQFGLFTLVGQSPLVTWCHPQTLARMEVPAEDRGKPCRFGGALGFDAARPGIRGLVDGWRRLALDPDCIDPPGASRANHRFDQAVLTNLVYRWERERGLTLGPDEPVDISATRPVPWISTRNKVPSWVPLAFDPLARGYFAVYKAADRCLLRARRGTRRADLQVRQSS